MLSPCLVLGLGLAWFAAQGLAKPGPKSPGAEAAQRDPEGIPLPGGLKRTSSTQEENSQRRTEIATYAAKIGMAELMADFSARMKQDGWTQTTPPAGGAGSKQMQLIDWRKSSKEVEARFYAEKDGTSALRIRVFTYPAASGSARSGDAAPKAATTSQAKAADGAEKSKQTGAAQTGAPPTSLNVRSFNPFMHQLTWTADRWTSFALYRRTAEGESLVAGNITALGFFDDAFLTPGTIYRLVVRHVDGSEGSLEYTHANPPQPGVVSNLKAVQTGPGKVKLTWDRERPVVNGVAVAETYQVTSPTATAVNQRVGTNELELSNLPVGNHWARVAMVYHGSRQAAPAPQDVSVNFDVLTDRARYRIVLLGLRCDQETKDDPLNLDGKNDEVYAGAYIVRVSRDSGGNTPSAPGSSVRTKVMGDTNGFASRVRAGSASVQGGIKSGDFLPSSAFATPQPGVAATSDQLPLLVWEGELRDSSDLLVVSPVLFAWNKADDAPWHDWVRWWSTPNGSRQLRAAARAAVRPDNTWARLSGEWQHDVNANTIHDDFPDPLTSLVNSIDPPLDPNRKRPYGPEFTLKGDRPIGLQDQNATGSVRMVPMLVWVPLGLVLTRPNIEAKLGRERAVLYTRVFVDDKLSTAALGGIYTLYIQIERLPEPAATVAPR